MMFSVIKLTKRRLRDDHSHIKLATSLKMAFGLKKGRHDFGLVSECQRILLGPLDLSTVFNIVDYNTF